MSRDDLETHGRDPSICDALSWRGLLSRRFNLRNFNLSAGGSSNQKQFRLATEFFGSLGFEKLRKQFDRIIVLWGITSTARAEMWSVTRNDHYNFFLSSVKDDFASFMTRHCYDHDAEVAQLRIQMLFWNRFFASHDICNFWFDTFNTHNYDYDFHNNRQKKTYTVNPIDSIKQQHYHAVAGPDWPSYRQFCSGEMTAVPDHIVKEIQDIFVDSDIDQENHMPTEITWRESDRTLDPIPNLIDYHLWPRDLMSRLMIELGIEVANDRQKYHLSGWKIDRDGMDQLVSQGILNPVSNHPTKQGHAMLCDYFSDKLQSTLAYYA